MLQVMSRNMFVVYVALMANQGLVSGKHFTDSWTTHVA